MFRKKSGLNPIDGMELPKFNGIRYSVSGEITIDNLKILFADMCGLGYTYQTLDKVVNGYIDRLIVWGGEEFEEEIKKDMEEKSCKDIYEYILSLIFKYDVQKKYRELPTLNVLGIDYDKFMTIYDRLDIEGFRVFLENSGTFLSKKDFYLENFLLTTGSSSEFIKKIFKVRCKKHEINIKYPEINIKEFIAKNKIEELSNDEQSLYEIYEDFCFLFSKELFMSVTFDYNSIDVVYDSTPWIPFVPSVFENRMIIEKKIYDFDFNLIVNKLENELNELPDIISYDKVDFYLNEIKGKIGKILLHYNVYLKEKSIFLDIHYDEWGNKDFSKIYLTILKKYMRYHFTFDISSFKQVKIVEN